MFTDFINRILGAEPRPSVSNRLENAEPSVIVKKDSSPKQPVPEKYRKDVVLLRSKYGDAFKTGFYINLTLQEALSVMPRERRIDSYRRLQSYLKRELGFTLLITSQKSRSKSTAL